MPTVCTDKKTSTNATSKCAYAHWIQRYQISRHNLASKDAGSYFETKKKQILMTMISTAHAAHT